MQEEAAREQKALDEKNRHARRGKRHKLAAPPTRRRS
jgi:hypothetical protein